MACTVLSARSEKLPLHQHRHDGWQQKNNRKIGNSSRNEYPAFITPMHILTAATPSQITTKITVAAVITPWSPLVNALPSPMHTPQTTNPATIITAVRISPSCRIAHREPNTPAIRLNSPQGSRIANHPSPKKSGAANFSAAPANCNRSKFSPLSFPADKATSQVSGGMSVFSTSLSQTAAGWASLGFVWHRSCHTNISSHVVVQQTQFTNRASRGWMLSFPFDFWTRTKSPSSIRSTPASHSGIAILRNSPCTSEIPREDSANAAPPSSRGIKSINSPLTFNTGPSSSISSFMRDPPFGRMEILATPCSASRSRPSPAACSDPPNKNSSQEQNQAEWRGNRTASCQDEVTPLPQSGEKRNVFTAST